MLEERAYLGLGCRSLDKPKPIAARSFGGCGSDYIDVIARLQFGFERYYLVIDLRADAFIADLGMNGVSKVDGRRALG